jgi:hypothetical protein
MTKFAVLTTFHDKGYQQYGRRAINTFLKQWPSDVKLYVYPQDHQVAESAPNLTVRDLHGSIPDLVAFKEKWKDDPKANGWVTDSTKKVNDKTQKIGFRWDAIRFSHKVYAVTHCAENCDADILMWMDADMVCHSPMTREFLEKMAGEHVDLGYLGREKKFSECGLYSMNLNSPITREFLRDFKHAYDSGELFNMEEWNDCWVFDEVRKKIHQKYPAWRVVNWSQGLIKGEGHPLINSAWGAYLDHLKGERKSTGKSQAKDLKIARNESYWKTL